MKFVMEIKKMVLGRPTLEVLNDYQDVLRVLKILKDNATNGHCTRMEFIKIPDDRTIYPVSERLTAKNAVLEKLNMSAITILEEEANRLRIELANSQNY